MDSLKTKISFASFLLFPLLSYAADVSQSAKNKEEVIAFYNAAFNQKNFPAAAQYLSPHYKQHSPHVADGPEGLKNFIQLLRDKYPNTHVEIKKIFADKDYVIVFVHFVKEPNTRGAAIMDIFRLQKHKIAEHWGVSQDIPEKSANSNGMF